MIIEKHGNLLTQTDCQHIAHQVNPFGKMGRGIARQIKQAFPESYIAYKYYCACNEEKYSRLKGKVLVSYLENGKHVLHCFSQREWNTDLKAVNEVFRQLSKQSYDIAIPKNYGCGLGGADWEKVMEIIKSYFENNNSANTLYIFDIGESKT